MSLSHLILGSLKYQPLSGYDLNKAFQASLQHFWNTDQSQIYRALHKLQNAGWVDVENVSQENAPDKKVYHLTEEGRDELHRWLTTPLPLATSHEAWLAQLFFGAELTKEELSTLLKSRIEQGRYLLDVFSRELPANADQYADLYHTPHEQPFWMLTVDYGLQRIRFELEWAQHALDQLDQLLTSPLNTAPSSNHTSSNKESKNEPHE